MKFDKRTVDHIISTRNVTSNRKIIENLEESRKNSTARFKKKKIDL